MSSITEPQGVLPQRQRSLLPQWWDGRVEGALGGVAVRRDAESVSPRRRCHSTRRSL